MSAPAAEAGVVNLGQKRQALRRGVPKGSKIVSFSQFFFKKDLLIMVENVSELLSELLKKK
jgi:hypothetical protein